MNELPGTVSADAIPAAAPSTILCVDDEPSILSALRRLFRAKGFQVRVAEGGRAGLEVLATEPIDLVISDMRMPEMDGVVFLEQVRQRWPDTMRLLLTGYADITSIMGAINRGEIYRYIAKPWDDNDIILIVRSALQQRAMEQEQRRLQALIAVQNEELKLLNTSLERKVAERTAELNQSNTALLAANDQLKNNFITSIKIFTSLIELRAAHLSGHSRRVADTARRLAQKLGLGNKQAQEVFVAGLLHNIGKVGFDDDTLNTPVVMLNTAQLQAFRKHPARAAQLLFPLPELKGAADIIAAHLERFDGAGYPDRLAGEKIPLGARILIVAADYDALQIGILAQRKLAPSKALDAIMDGSGKRYDPKVVAALVTLMGEGVHSAAAAPAPVDTVRKVRDLLPGMVLARDLMTPSGLLMLTAGHVLDDAVIGKIMDFEKSMGLHLAVEVEPGLP
ncbi:MAG: two-component system response regulator [Rhodoferax ferrireducens]|uniref:Two-component system response regulator n=1 Tax=Rhodoferax ferrireducens TaxID=192843 RepID=A0A1W9KZR2_9BURK|nr:MAG: two-component system response regulator [Rhodoferax ferrireducens]